jgi:hypothetical protein
MVFLILYGLIGFLGVSPMCESLLYELEEKRIEDSSEAGSSGIRNIWTELT